MAVAQWLLQGASLFFEYDTPKIVHIKSKKIGIFSRLIQLLIISYIVGWAIIHERGYQESSPVESSFITKVKGTTSSDTEGNKELYNRSVAGLRC